MPKENVSTKAKTKQADAVMDSQLDIPQFNSCLRSEQHYDREEREDKFIMYSFVVMMTILNFIILAKQIW